LTEIALLFYSPNPEDCTHTHTHTLMNHSDRPHRRAVRPCGKSVK